MSKVDQQLNRRRTFAIISHPDAGKTTLTEKLLLFGGAINMAGAVKAKKAARHATSDWMKMEQERGISVTCSVMQFMYRDRVINLLDTKNVTDVFIQSGSASDDGYLSTVQGRQQLQTYQAYGDVFARLYQDYYYQTYLMNAALFGPPRQVRVGLRIDF